MGTVNLGEGSGPARRDPRRRRRLGSAGSSLLEALVGMGIASSVFLAAQPVFSLMMQVYGLHGAARGVFSELQTARMAAVMENTPYQMRLGADGSLVVERYNAQSTNWQQQSRIKANDDLKNVYVSISNTIAFTPSGMGASPGSVTLVNPDGARKTVEVSNAGSIRIR